MRWAGLRTPRFTSSFLFHNLTLHSSSNFVALQVKEEDEDTVDGVDENTTVMFSIWDKLLSSLGCKQKQVDTMKY